MKSTRIVAEITKNWGETTQDSAYAKPSPELPDKPVLLSERFEHAIAVNKERGYELESWQYQKVAHPDQEYMHKTVISETIIAVFILKDNG